MTEPSERPEEAAVGGVGVDRVVWSPGLGAGSGVGGDRAPGGEGGVISHMGRCGEEVTFLAKDYEFGLGCNK